MKSEKPDLSERLLDFAANVIFPKNEIAALRSQ